MRVARGVIRVKGKREKNMLNDVEGGTARGKAMRKRTRGGRGGERGCDASEEKRASGACATMPGEERQAALRILVCACKLIVCMCERYT